MCLIIKLKQLKHQIFTIEKIFMIGLSFIKKLIINNSDLINKDLEKGSYQDSFDNVSNTIKPFYSTYNYNITIVTDYNKDNKMNDITAFQEIL